VQYVESHMLEPFIASANDPVRGTVVRRIAAQFRQIWNARGAADVDAVEGRMMSDSSMTAAIRALDR
jgi:hypothetical protein